MKLIDDKTIEDLEYSLGLDLLSGEEIKGSSQKH